MGIGLLYIVGYCAQVPLKSQVPIAIFLQKQLRPLKSQIYYLPV